MEGDFVISNIPDAVTVDLLEEALIKILVNVDVNVLVNLILMLMLNDRLMLIC